LSLPLPLFLASTVAISLPLFLFQTAPVCFVADVSLPLLLPLFAVSMLFLGSIADAAVVAAIDAEISDESIDRRCCC